MGVEISTHTPRAGSDCLQRGKDGFVRISTHTPRAGSDVIGRHAADIKKISTHTPRAGSDRNILRHTLFAIKIWYRIANLEKH